MIKEDFIIDQSVFIAKPNETFLKYISAIQGILASKLISIYFKYTSNEFDELFPKIKIGEWRELSVYIYVRFANDKIETQDVSVIYFANSKTILRA